MQDGCASQRGPAVYTTHTCPSYCATSYSSQPLHAPIHPLLKLIMLPPFPHVPPRHVPPQSLLNPYNLRVSIQEIVTLKSHLGDKDIMAALSKLSVKIR